MRNPDKYIRKYFFDTLNNLVVNGKTLKVYDSHSPNNDSAFIVLSSQYGQEVRNIKCHKDIECAITIDIITRYPAQFGSQLFADDIKEAVLNLTENIEIQNFIIQEEPRIEFPDIAPILTTTESVFRKLIVYNFKIS